MLKMLSFSFLCSILAITNIGGYTSHMSLVDYFSAASSVYVIVDGAEQKCSPEQTKQIVACLEKMLTAEGAYEMPAFGVSIHNLTVQEMQKGYWVKFVFEKEQEHNCMPFTELVFQVNPTHYGFNMIRKVEGLYQGRCFYYNLAAPMQPLWDCLKNMHM